MANPRAFISFDFDNNAGEKMYFVGQAVNSRTPFNIEDWSSKEALAQSTWQKIIEDKMKRCNMMIVLVGRNMGTATGVNKEIDMAIKNNVPFFGVYVAGANSSSILPVGLARNRVIQWTWDGIAKAISQMMKEGKNL
ncbi:TIR domain-containing protein [Chryseobacterium capnotolerans]|uniref:TIR domain-containing protein n=1 Tax=Chryseobacterium TaxID=59732 RepID=UPI00083ACAEC|nr:MULTISPECIES: TIR domain-containing protein [Chryseobacterium]UHO40606.1 TIR domain-containing protein [Chryseobacterium capnotolerans]